MAQGAAPRAQAVSLRRLGQLINPRVARVRLGTCARMLLAVRLVLRHRAQHALQVPPAAAAS